MSHKSQILDLARRLDDLPIRHEDQLKTYLVDLKLTLKDIFGIGNQYLDYLKFVKFRPDAVFVTERELQRAWLSGKAQVANLLKVVLNDPAVRGQEPEVSLLDPGTPEETSIRRFTDLQDSILGVLGDFQKEVLNRPEVEAEEGPIKDPLRKESALRAQPPSRPAEMGETMPLKTLNGIFMVPGSDQMVNGDVADFFAMLGLEVIRKDNDRRRGEGLIDQLNRAAAMEFAIVMLNADYHFYPRTQSYESARLMASQDLIFQLGYLVAKMGRERVAVLYHESDHFRRPTDYFDIHYVPWTAKASWKAELTKLLKTAGVVLASETDPSLRNAKSSSAPSI